MDTTLPIDPLGRAPVDPAPGSEGVAADASTTAGPARDSAVTRSVRLQHRWSLSSAGLVAGRPEGPGPLSGPINHDGAFWRDRFVNLRNLLKGTEP